MFKFLKKIFSFFQPIDSLHVAYDSRVKHRPTIILLHGIAASSSTWDNLIKELDVKNNRVIAIDLLGFGKSPKPENCEYTVDDHVKYLRKTINKLKINGKFKIVGHSMGAIIASRYCRRYPFKVKSLYLASPPIYVEKTNLRSFIEKTRTDFFMNAYRFLSEQKDFTINGAGYLRKIFNVKSGMEVDETTWQSFRKSLINTIVNQTVADDIKTMSKPVDILYGVLDEFLIQESIDKLNNVNQIKVTKINFVDHLVSPRFAQEIAKSLKQ